MQRSVHNISMYYVCNKVAGVFRKAILWSCFDRIASKHVPQDILLRVRSQYKHICTLDPKTNPVKKVGLIVCGHEGEIIIDDLVVDGEWPAIDDTYLDKGFTSFKIPSPTVPPSQIF